MQVHTTESPKLRHKFHAMPRLVRRMVEKAQRIPVCGHCQGNMWRTVKKGEEWRCRYCNTTRRINPA